MNILLIGCTGSGKTWVMKRLIHSLKCNKREKLGKFYYHTNGEIIILGRYDNSTFEGSDKLSRAVLGDLTLFKSIHGEKLVIAEGDRFTNSKYLYEMNPTIIKILDTGELGRAIRKSNQTNRHSKRFLIPADTEWQALLEDPGRL